MRLIDFVSLALLWLFITLGQLIDKWPVVPFSVLCFLILVVLIVGRLWARERLR